MTCVCVCVCLSGQLSFIFQTILAQDIWKKRYFKGKGRDLALFWIFEKKKNIRKSCFHTISSLNIVVPNLQNFDFWRFWVRYMSVMGINRTDLMRQNRECTFLLKILKQRRHFFYTKNWFLEALDKIRVCYGYQSNRLYETKQRVYFSADIFETYEVFCWRVLLLVGLRG